MRLRYTTGYAVRGSISRGFSVRPLLLIWAVSLVLFFSLLRFGGLKMVDAYSPQPGLDLTAAVVGARANVPAASAKPTQTPPSTQSVRNVASKPVPIPACTPAAGGVSALALSGLPAGLTQVVDSPRAYQIYGRTSTDLRQQVQRCAPHEAGSSAAFTAETYYQMNWQYSYSVSGGVCSISDVKVGLHVSQVLPYWQPSTGVQNGLPSQWSLFMRNLTTHENGHVALDKQYAQTLLNDLQSLPPTDCNAFQQTVQHLTNSDISQLNQANDNYDATTNHGETQGAILP